MAIERIDAEACSGCGICVNTCSSDVIRIGDNKKAYIRYPEDCMVCLYCEEDCPEHAIFVSPVKTYPILQAWG